MRKTAEEKREAHNAYNRARRAKEREQLDWKELVRRKHKAIRGGATLSRKTTSERILPRKKEK